MFSLSAKNFCLTCSASISSWIAFVSSRKNLGFLAYRLCVDLSPLDWAATFFDPSFAGFGSSSGTGRFFLVAVMKCVNDHVPVTTFMSIAASQLGSPLDV